ncbi:MAG: (d)CMP kinase [Acidimicrobiales bacterium]|nr:(d)CMP kinase [Acidimicrobiales bacterium]
MNSAVSTKKLRVLAIDGPAGAGKSTISKLVAKRLGLFYLDTGAMYRGFAYKVLLNNIDPSDELEVKKLISTTTIYYDKGVTVDGNDVTREIRTEAVTNASSIVSSVKEVREFLVALQRSCAISHDGSVVEGRDMGSVVFTDAQLKIFLTASVEERAKRRAIELGDADVAKIYQEISKRDKRDSTRDTSPLVIPRGAFLIDTTGRDIESIVDEISRMWHDADTESKEI